MRQLCSTLLMVLFSIVFICYSLCAMFVETSLLASTTNVYGADTVNVPIIMYHLFLKDSSKWGKFILPPDQFANDIAYIKERGYEPIFFSQLIDYVENGTPLPQKPIMITFDDGYYNNYLYAFPVLKQYDCKAVFSVIGKYADLYSQTGEANAYYTHATWSQIDEMLSSGLVEIQNHSYDLHSNTKERTGAAKKKGESTEVYQKLLFDDLKRNHDLIVEHTGVSPSIFTYPFGSMSKDSEAVIKQLGYKGSLSCETGTNQVTRDPECLFKMKRYNRPYGKSSKEFFDPFLP